MCLHLSLFTGQNGRRLRCFLATKLFWGTLSLRRGAPANLSSFAERECKNKISGKYGLTRLSRNISSKCVLIDEDLLLGKFGGQNR